MGIYISDLDIPKDKAVQIVIIRDDGVCVDEWGNTYGVVSLPSHGRLIDADALKTDCDLVHSMMMFGGQKVYTQTAIDNAPTIIGANYPPSIPLEQVWTEVFGEDGE